MFQKIKRFILNIPSAFVSFWQKLTRGFSDDEIWELDHNMARLILPRLKRFKEMNVGMPQGYSYEEFNAHLDMMIESFEFFASKDYYWGGIESRRMQSKHMVGLQLFAKHYPSLWI